MNQPLKTRLEEIQNRLCSSGYVTDDPSKAIEEIERLEAELATARHDLNTVGHITADRLSSLLVKRGVIHEAAVADQDGYDGGRTEDAINAVVSELKGKP